MLLIPRLLVFICILGFALAIPTLPAGDALRKIAKILGKEWDFNVDPCSGSSEWVNSEPLRGEGNNVTCNCFLPNTTKCHVVSIVLKGQRLSGSVPREIVQLPFLQRIDLSWNNLSGTIPPEWGSMKLAQDISLNGNQITGPIPKELANITTLVNLTLEGNQLSGSIPRELGILPQIERLIFISNNLTGEIPRELANLSTLKDFRISDNKLTGPIPEFIQNWTNIEKLVIQGSGLSGPIPRGIVYLTKLIDLRISDLNGGNESSFPSLHKVDNLTNLILRSCNITGELPRSIGDMKALRVLDLSFNKLRGEIPKSFGNLSNIKYIYLTGNYLSGRLPSWLVGINGGGMYDGIDLSYNNFTTEDDMGGCQLDKINLFASVKRDTSGIVSCLRQQSRSCERNYSSVHINCGGQTLVDDEGTTYEADMNRGGPSNFKSSDTNWGFSSTGHFIDDDRPIDSFIWAINRGLSEPDSQLYRDVRFSPLSLTYYSFCLMNGNYTVQLHFTRTMWVTENANVSHGRRLFDIYIQGNRVLKDFEIAYEADGNTVRITKNFTAIVNDNTLDIRFYWAGKGTVSIPFRGAYGPQISAISLDLHKPPSGLPVGAIVGIVMAVLLSIILALAVLWWKCSWQRKETTQHGVYIGPFNLKQISAATNNFDPVNKIGEGGFGSVYKGRLADGTVVAVKQLSSKSKQGNREFVNEIGVISAVQHPHLVKLYGCSVEEDQLLLVYEYMENNSLARALFGPEEQRLHLDWPTRHKICIGIARGLAYLHGESRIKIIHRDIKATNVLLDRNFVPKISDFGLARLHKRDNSHISTGVAGTFGYMAPEYVLRGYLTDKVDVYSFGVVLLEIISGRNNIAIGQDDDCFCLLDWVDSLKEKGNLLELVDPRLGSHFDRKEVMTAINVAGLCTNTVAKERPSMSAVVNMLEGKVDFTEFVGESRLSLHIEFEGFDDTEL